MIPVNDGDGRCHSIIHISQDVTERKCSEENCFRSIIEKSSDAMVVMDADGTIFYRSPSYQRLLGYKTDGWVGSPFDSIHLNDLAGAVDGFTQLVQNPGGTVQMEVRVRHQDGSWVPVEATGYNLLDDQSVKGIVASFRDITKRKQAEHALFESETKFRTIFENANDAIIYLDEFGIVIDANNQLKDIFGYDREEAIGKSFAEFAFVDSETMHKILELFAKSFIDGSKDLLSFTVKRKDGSSVYVEASTSTVQRNGGQKGCLAIIRDITERRLAEENIARARALEELDSLRTALLASISHELRTPLTSIKGMASSLVQPDIEWDQETQKDFIRSIDQASDRLAHIVDDLLDMSQLEAGMMKLDKQETLVSFIVKQLKDQLTDLTQNHQFEVHMAPDLPAIKVDEVRFGQVIINLVSNAASYSEPGTQISLEIHNIDNEIVVSVTDQGVGISAEHADKVFDRFYRLESGVARRRGGTGLGLAICKGIVGQHCGRIWVESVLGQGSKFSFSLPIEQDSQKNQLSS